MTDSIKDNTTGAKPDLRKPANILILTSICIAVLAIMWQRAQLGFRAGHMDEYDYLFVAKMLLADLQWPTHTYIFGSDLSWYLFGWGEAFFGGLAGARLVAALLGLLSLVGVYLFTKQVWQSKRVALLATLLMAAAAGHIFISRLASYDAVSFTFFSLAMMPLLRSCQLNKSTDSQSFRYMYLLCGILLLLGAVLTKYTTAAYLPFIGLFMLIAAPMQALVGGTILVLGIAAYLSMHWTELVVLYQVQISGTHGANTTYKDILYRAGYYAGLPALLTLLATRHEKRTSGQSQNVKILLLLLLFSCPLFLYHLQGKNLISLYKHLNFSLFFLVGGAAWLVMKIYDHYKSNAYSQAATVRLTPAFLAGLLAFYTLLNLQQLKDMESGYPNVQGLVSHIQKQSLQGHTSILSEDPYLFRYFAFGEISQDQIRETSWLDNDKDGVHSHQDVLDALWDRKFNTVLLTDAIHPDKNIEYRKILSQRGYVQHYEESYELSTVMTTNKTGNITLYRLSAQTANSDL